LTAWICNEISCPNEERRPSFKGEMETIPPFHDLQVSFQVMDGSLKGGHTIERGGHNI